MKKPSWRAPRRLSRLTVLLHFNLQATCSHLKSLFRCCPHASVSMSKIVADGRRVSVYAESWLLLMRSVSSNQFLNLDFEFTCTLIPMEDAWYGGFETGGPVLGLDIEDIPSANSFVDGVAPGVSIRHAVAPSSATGAQVLTASGIAEGNANGFDALITCPLDPGTAVRIIVYPNLPPTIDGNPQLTIDVNVTTTFGFAREIIRERLGLQPQINLQLFHRGVGFSQVFEMLECWQFFTPQELGVGPLVLVFSYDLEANEVEDPSLWGQARVSDGFP
jgi:hypothetical protein